MEFDKALGEIETFSTSVRVTSAPWDKVHTKPTPISVASYVVGRVKPFKALTKEHRLKLTLCLAEGVMELPMQITVHKVYQSVLFRIESGKKYKFVTAE